MSSTRSGLSWLRRGSERATPDTLLLRPEGTPPAGSGVLVTVGTNEARFDRLLHAVDGLDLGGEQVTIQYGASHVRPDGAELVDFLPFDELNALTRSSRVVVCHAGIGSVAMALAHGRRPIVGAKSTPTARLWTIIRCSSRGG